MFKKETPMITKRLKKLRAAAGRYYQFPEFEPMFGLVGNRALRSERATHYNASVERLLGNRARVLAEVYDREDANLIFSLNEPRLTGHTVTFQVYPFQNSLAGHARGLELTVQRRSANKLSGWISYAYSRTRLNDARDGLVRGTSGQRVCPGQIDHGDRLPMLGVGDADFLLYRYARVVAHLLLKAGKGIEKRAFAAIRIADERVDGRAPVRRHEGRLQRSGQSDVGRREHGFRFFSQASSVCSTTMCSASLLRNVR